MMKKVLLIAILSLMSTSFLFAQGSRQNIDFNNDWSFTKDTSAAVWEPVTLPHTYNQTDMQTGKNFYTGNGFYRKKIFVDNQSKGKRIFLRFGGVGQVATVYINGKFLTEHKGAYSAFAFEITNVINYGAQNEILVKANNTPDKTIIPINNFLFPIYGGIYRQANMIVTAPLNFSVTDYASSGIQVIQKEVSVQNAKVLVKAKLENREKLHQNINLSIIISDNNGVLVAQSQKPVTVSPQGVTYITGDVELVNPRLWNGIKDPYLYKISAILLKDNKEIDRVEEPLGLRSIELIAGKGVYLNGENHPMYGVTRHQDRWQYGSALSPEQEKEDMMLIKEIGATTIRLAHYQQSDHIYALADSLGFLTWAEIPFVNAVSFQEADNAKQQMEELVRQNRNHPSIYIWGMHNEVYGKTKDDYVPVLTRELNDIAKTNDPYVTLFR
jgi:beta-galactosidase